MVKIFQFPSFVLGTTAICIILASVTVLSATSAPLPTPETSNSSTETNTCIEQLGSLPGKFNAKKIATLCLKAQNLAGCESHEGAKIIHLDHQAAQTKGKKILAIALIHGDEKPAGTVARTWLERLTDTETRSHWRIIPMLNPDGVKHNTRTNARGVDLNRNFPTADWEKNALGYWEKNTKKDRRRYPGPTPASEKETQCAMKHLEDYQPDFVISVHTPLAVLDFDGPKDMRFPKYGKLPWKTLGNFPGSLGRFMWADRSRPVATVELAGNQVLESLDQYEKLQDVLGTVATQVQASKADAKTSP